MSPRDNRGSDTGECSIHLFIAGQRDGHLDQKLSRYPSILLETAVGHSRDIEAYTKLKAREICLQFSANSEVEENIIAQVTKAARGKSRIALYSSIF